VEAAIAAALIGAVASLVLGVLNHVREGRISDRQATLEVRQAEAKARSDEQQRTHEREMLALQNRNDRLASFVQDWRPRRLQEQTKFLALAHEYGEICQRYGLLEFRIADIISARDDGAIGGKVFEKRRAEAYSAQKPVADELMVKEREVILSQSLLRLLCGEEVVRSCDGLISGAEVLKSSPTGWGDFRTAREAFIVACRAENDALTD
jgi:hypothetical protein